jgi:hypothetical protein
VELLKTILQQQLANAVEIGTAGLLEAPRGRRPTTDIRGAKLLPWNGSMRGRLSADHQ